MVRRKNTALRKAPYAFFAIFIVAIVIVRLYFSMWVLDYVNNVLAHIDGFQGSVASINVDLYRGAYRINKLVLNKVNGKIPAPFLNIETIDFSVQWAALLHGRIVSTVTLVQPVLNFAVNGEAKQTGGDVDWTAPIKALSPVDINYVKFVDGSVTYQDFSSTPHVNIFIHEMQGEIENLRNVVSKDDPLPSPINVQGTSIGNGKLQIKGRMNILKDLPDMDILLALENVNLPAINNYTEAYAAFDFKSGNFNVYSHTVVSNGHVSGYIKPMLTHLSVDILKKDNPAEVIWSSAVAGVLKIFTNLSHDQFATRVDLDGELGHIGTDSWSALWGVISNAFISAMSKGFEETGNDGLIKSPPAGNSSDHN